jgi:hypothetical protein
VNAFTRRGAVEPWNYERILLDGWNVTDFHVDDIFALQERAHCLRR